MPTSFDESTRQEAVQAVKQRSDRLDELLERNYPSLHRMAGVLFRGERAAHTLNPTDLVHEAFLRLVGQPRASAEDTLFFRACFARQCRRILVDHARRRRALRRGGEGHRESLHSQPELGLPQDAGLIEIHEAVEALAEKNTRMGRIAELRLFAGLTIAECASSLGLAPRTVAKDWAFAQSYLRKDLE